MERPSARERLRYRFDTFMARGTVALVIGLAAVSVLIILAIGVLVMVTGAYRSQDPPLGFWESLWRNLLRTLDPGTMGGDTGSGLYLALMLAVTVGGIFVISALIGVLSSGLESRLDELRKGRSRVIEHGHTVILGWSTQVFTVIEQLIEANANQRRATIVVLADMDKVEMEDEIRSRVHTTKTTKIVCRHGRPTDPDEIDIANVQTSKAVIVLSPETDDPDAEVLKTVLAITNDPDRRPEPYHVVAVLRNGKNADVARLIGKDELELVVVDDLIARITAQACRQSGLSLVYTDLLDFGGDEIYFTRQPSLAGRTFGEALLAFDTSVLIGIRDGSVQLDPPPDTVIGPHAELIVISADDDTIHATDPREATAPDVEASDDAAAPEQTLVLGWNARAASAISELDHYVADGSSVVVVAPDEARPDVEALAANVRSTVTFEAGNTTDRSTLESLDVARFDHVIVLSEESEDRQAADAHTLITLLHLRDLAGRTGGRFSITSEMLDPRNRTLAEIAKADDFIVSDQLASLLVTQIAEHKHLGGVFDDVFDAEGAEIYLKEAGRYVTPNATSDFYAVTAAARSRREVAIGYRVASKADDAAAAYGIVLNPRKSDALTLAPEDRVIVLASD